MILTINHIKLDNDLFGYVFSIKPRFVFHNQISDDLVLKCYSSSLHSSSNVLKIPNGIIITFKLINIDKFIGIASWGTAESLTPCIFLKSALVKPTTTFDSITDGDNENPASFVPFILLKFASEEWEWSSSIKMFQESARRHVMIRNSFLGSLNIFKIIVIL